MLPPALTVSTIVLQNNIPDTSVYRALPKQRGEGIIIASGGQEYIMDCSLVLSALSIEHQVDQDAGVILIRNEDSEQTVCELQAFEKENRNWPPLREQPHPTSTLPVQFWGY